MATREVKLIVIFVVSLTILQVSNAAITPLDNTYTGTENEDVSIPWAYDNAADMETVDWSYKSSSTATTTTIMSKIGAADATVFNTFNVEHVSDGSITLIAVTLENTGIYYCTVAYSLSSGHATVTGTATLSVTPATPDCCCCLIDCKDMKITECYVVNIIIYIIIFMCFSIIVGFVVEAIFNIWEKMSLKWRIASFVFFLFGLGLFICYLIKKMFAAFWYVVITYDGTLINGNWPLGASVGAFCVTNVTARGPADGKLKNGDQIHAINEETVTGKDQKKLKEMMKDKTKLILHVSKVGSTDHTSRVELNYKKGEQLGFDFENLAMVTKVTENSIADGKLKKGQRILSINGTSTAGVSNADINRLLKQPPKSLELTIKKGREIKKSTLRFNGKPSLGIAIRKEEGNIVVSAIEPQSAAAISKEVHVDDCILSVNGVSTAGLQVSDIKEMLTFSIILKVTKDITLIELDPDQQGSFGLETFQLLPSASVKFNKQTTTMTSVTPVKPTNMVESVNGPAARQGIKAGDTIVSINGEKTKGKSHHEIQTMLESFGGSISFKIKKAAFENGKPHVKSPHEPLMGRTEAKIDNMEKGAPDSGREGSGSVASRKDVDLQGTDTFFKKSQVPGIQTTGDVNKSRGQSDVGHPLDGTVIPTQKAGALDAIPDSAREKVKKKKKTRKRRVDAEDDQSD